MPAQDTFLEWKFLKKSQDRVATQSRSPTSGRLGFCGQAGACEGRADTDGMRAERAREDGVRCLSGYARTVRTLVLYSFHGRSSTRNGLRTPQNIEHG